MLAIKHESHIVEGKRGIGTKGSWNICLVGQIVVGTSSHWDK